MQAKGPTIDLERLGLSSGQAKRVELDIPLDPIHLGGQTYDADGLTRARLDASRTTTGHALRLRLEPSLQGPCVRCLEDSVFALQIDAREVDQPSARDEELQSPYVSDGELDVEHWANDAVVLALPAKPICHEDCAGLCAVCGESLNDAEPGAHDHPSGGDPRMAKLKDLKLD